jgi:hypothetical protein
VVSHRSRRRVIFRYRVIIDFRENVDLNHIFLDDFYFRDYQNK